LSNPGRLPVRAKERVGHPDLRVEVFTPRDMGVYTSAWTAYPIDWKGFAAYVKYW
jgi:hypothetical protein